MSTFSLDMFLNIAFDSPKYLESWKGASGFQFVVLGLAGLAAIMLRPRPLTILALAAGMFLIIAISVNTVYIRYLYPAFPLLLLAFAALSPRVEEEADRSLFGRSITVILPGLLAGTVVLNLMFLPSAGWILRNFDLDAIFTPDGRQKVILRDVPDRALIDIINAQVGTRARIGVMGHTITAGLHGTPLFGNWYNFRLNQQLMTLSSTIWR
jgi:hypothetical protein